MVGHGSAMVCGQTEWGDGSKIHQCSRCEVKDLKALLAWQPIETAPKDGTEMWAYSPKWGQYKTAWRPQDCKGWGCIDSCCGYYEDLAPTHWMPLPEPPSADETRGVTPDAVL